MKVQFKKWRPLYGLYVFIYLPWFFALERVFTGDHPRMHLIDTAFDQSIPFCEYFIIPYYFWFIYIVAGCLFFMIYASDREYIQLALSLIIGMSLFGKVGFMKPTTKVIIGSVIYQACLTAAQKMGVPSAYNKLIMAVMFTAAIVISNAKKEGAKNA